MTDPSRHIEINHIEFILERARAKFEERNTAFTSTNVTIPAIVVVFCVVCSVVCVVCHGGVAGIRCEQKWLSGRR